MSKLVTQEEFIDKLIKIYGDKYDLSKVNYINNKTKVSLFCKIHGWFDKRPFELTSKFYVARSCACPKCSKRISNDVFLDKVDRNFIKEYNIVGDYIKNNVGVEVNHMTCGSNSHPRPHQIYHNLPSCKLCGRYSMQLKHINGNKEIFDNEMAKLYLVKMSNGDEEFYKIGRTIKESVENGRFSKHVSGGYDVEVIESINMSTYYAANIEFELVKFISRWGIKYNPKNKFGGSDNECFKISDINSFGFYEKVVAIRGFY